MLDGTTEATNLEKTEENRAFIRSFVEEVLIRNQLDRLDHYIYSYSHIEHNQNMADGLPALRHALSCNDSQRCYDNIHRVLAEGSFVLSVTGESRT